MRRFIFILVLSVFFIHCQKIGKINPGKYDVADQEYSRQNYLIERELNPQGNFTEKHEIDRCLLMEMKGDWKQIGETLTLQYEQSRNRASCKDSLLGWASDSSKLEIPLRHVEVGHFESYLLASGGQAAKWILWNRVP